MKPGAIEARCQARDRSGAIGGSSLDGLRAVIVLGEHTTSRRATAAEDSVSESAHREADLSCREEQPDCGDCDANPTKPLGILGELLGLS